jgi:hypothetical protein
LPARKDSPGGRILCGPANVIAAPPSGSPNAENEDAMTFDVIRYQTKPEATEPNTELIRDVFRELAAAAPEHVRYAVLRTGDGTFVHVVSYDDDGDRDSLTGLPAFAKFVDGGEERRIAPPERAAVTVVGNYRMLENAVVPVSAR